MTVKGPRQIHSGQKLDLYSYTEYLVELELYLFPSTLEEIAKGSTIASTLISCMGLSRVRVDE